MRRFLTTPIRNGSFDFISNLIEIQKYNGSSKQLIENALSLNIEQDGIKTLEEVEIISVFYHEIIHFLDMTTTTWGLEYNIRKAQFIQKRLLEGQETYDTLEVFKLNVAEVQVHDSLICIYNPGKEVSLLNCELKHHLVYDKKFGPLVMIDFFQDGSLELSVPFSMLSVLESNAYTCETLMKIKCLDNLESRDIGIVEKKMIERSFKDFLNDKDYLEYNLILILMNIHFKELSMIELLLFAKTLIGFVLNLSSMEISLVSTFIKYSFQNTYIGNSIVKDMQRGMSRHILVFKFILMMYEYLNSDNDCYKMNTIEAIKNDPKEFIDGFVNEYIMDHLETFIIEEISRLEIEMYFKGFQKYIWSPDVDIIIGSLKNNREYMLTSKGKEILDVSALYLTDIFLSDGTVIEVPNRININIEDYFEKNLDLFSRIETAFKDTSMSKFHIHPDDVSLV